jgi:glycosidase
MRHRIPASYAILPLSLALGACGSAGGTDDSGNGAGPTGTGGTSAQAGGSKGSGASGGSGQAGGSTGGSSTGGATTGGTGTGGTDAGASGGTSANGGAATTGGSGGGGTSDVGGSAVAGGSGGASDTGGASTQGGSAGTGDAGTGGVSQAGTSSGGSDAAGGTSSGGSAAAGMSGSAGTTSCDGGPAEVFGHSATTLYRVDAVTHDVTKVGNFSCLGLDEMIDIALDKTGQMYGTEELSFVKIDKTTATCQKIATGSFPNSLSFVPAGTVLPNTEALVGYQGSTYVQIDIQSGALSTIGDLNSGSLSSSGDIVSVINGGTYLTVNGTTADGQECGDCVVEVDPKDGHLIQVLGDAGHSNVFGLAFWAGIVYGFDDSGELFSYDVVLKTSTNISIPMKPAGLSFYGAGSTTCAPPMKPLRTLVAQLLRASISLGVLASIAIGCHHDDAPTDGIPRQSCQSVIWAIPASEGSQVTVRGSWDEWSAETPLVPFRDTGWVYTELSLSAGQYGYEVLNGGLAGLDPNEPQSTFHGETEVSLLSVADCLTPRLAISSVETDASGVTTIQGTFYATGNGPPLAASSVRADSTATGVGDPATGNVVWTLPAGPSGKSTVTLSATDQAGAMASARATVWRGGPDGSDHPYDSGLIYQVMIDRFRGDGGAALSPPPTPGSRAGGTLDGVRSAIEDGTFAALGVTALWISPVYTNPTEARLGLDGHEYEGYHGYWPQSSREVDPRIGGEDALHALVQSAHASGLRVLLDVVPNHVYESNPRYLQHQTDGYFHVGEDDCICGTTGCDWGTHILSCWFASYLPDIRYEDDDAMQDAVADASFWQDTFDLDGIRIDAVPMVPRATTRRTVSALRASMAPRSARFSIGEVFTGPGISELEQIKYYLGPDGMDAAFDFPLMWAVRDVVASGTGEFPEIDQLLDAEDSQLSGSGSLLGRMIGNHDTTRFASVSNGDAGQDPWGDPPSSDLSQDVYDRQWVALALTMTLPGLAVLYYGDELAMPGGGDPDSRRVLPAEASLTAPQVELRRRVRALGQLRTCAPSLQSGTRTLLASTTTTTAYLRIADGAEPILVALSTDESPTNVFVGSAIAQGNYVDLVTGESISLSGDRAATVSVPPRAARVLLPQGSSCLRPRGS